jgi:hypothetical protein
MHAIVRAALTAVRATPENQAERVSEETLGAVLRVLEQKGDWALCRGEDGYEGWLHVGSLLVCVAEEAEAWWDEGGGVPAVTLDATLVDDAGRLRMHLPWGARVALIGSTARLPDGRTGRLAEGSWVAWDQLGDRYPQDGAAVTATALEWMGVPYIWGGRTRWGTDCSGFVQSIYRLHGLLLPRDSRQQAEIGEPIGPAADYSGLRPGDLLFFRGRESERVVHVALSLGGPAILHAAQENGSVMNDELGGESELERSLAAGLVGVRRLFWSG